MKTKTFFYTENLITGDMKQLINYDPEVSLNFLIVSLICFFMLYESSSMVFFKLRIDLYLLLMIEYVEQVLFIPSH